MVDIHLCGCGSVPVRRFFCLFWRETHTKGVRARLPTRPIEDERKQRSQSRTEESREQSRTGQSAGESSRQKSREADGQRKATARTCGPRGRVCQRERMSQHSWWLCGNFARIHARDSQQMHRKLHKSVTNTFLLALELTQVRVVCFLFFHLLDCVCCVLCIFKEM